MLKRLFGRKAPPPPPPPPPAPQQQAPAPVAPPAPAPVAPAPEAAVLAAAADGILATDKAGQITFVNRAALDHTRYGERELLGNSLHALLHPGCEDPSCPVPATQRDGKPRTFVTETMRRRDGSQVAAEVVLSAMRDGGLVAVLHDLGERRAEEDALRATAEGYRDLVEGVEDWIWTADRSGIVTFSNRAGEALLGRRPAQVIGNRLLDFIAPDAREEEARRLDEAAAAKSGWSVTVRRVHADGSEPLLDSRASPVLDGDGELLGWRGVERPATHEPTPEVTTPPSEQEGELTPPPTTLTAKRKRHREVAIVRQPIADADGSVVGYELLVGGHALGPRPLGEAGTTAAMLLDVFGDVGIERLAGRHPAWVSITPGFLLEVGTPPVRPDRVVLQLHAAPVSADVLAALQRLRWSGYTVALTGYDGRAELAELLDVAGIVKVTVAPRTDEELRTILAKPLEHKVGQLVATRVDSPEEVQRCAALGFNRFQGVYFAKPNLVRQRRVGTGGIASLKTLSEVAKPDASFEDLEKAISADVGLSLKLLRYVNSAFFSLPRTLGSVHEALTLLGTATVRRWATVMALVEATADAPEELVELALQRARMLETLGGSPESDSADTLFTVGLFSVADALLDRPMDEVLESLPFTDEIQAALLRQEGEKGELLATVMSYERGEFPEAGQDAPMSLPDAYADAVPWAEDAKRATAP